MKHNPCIPQKYRKERKFIYKGGFKRNQNIKRSKDSHDNRNLLSM